MKLIFLSITERKYCCQKQAQEGAEYLRKCPARLPPEIESIQTSDDQPLFSFRNPTPDGDPVLNISVEPKYTAQITVANEDAFLEFVRKTLMAIGNRFLKTMCKSFIKTIDPNRRKTYPYSKSNTEHGEQPPSYPPWWPPDLRFKEPDHLIQPECERLIEFMLTWCLNNGQFCVEALWKDMWLYFKYAPGPLQRTTDRNKKIYMLDQLEHIASQREAFLRGATGRRRLNHLVTLMPDADDTKICHAFFFEQPAPYKAAIRKRKRSPLLENIKPSIQKEPAAVSPTVKGREPPAPATEKSSHSRRPLSLEPQESETPVLLHTRPVQHRQERFAVKHQGEDADVLCESCRACDCRKLSSLPSRTVPLRLANDDLGEPNVREKHGGPHELGEPAMPDVSNMRQRDGNLPGSSFDGGPRFFSSGATGSPIGSGAQPRGRPVPDPLVRTWSFSSPFTAFTGSDPGSDGWTISPRSIDGLVDGLPPFGGRLDQVVPATPSEKGFITDTTADELVAGDIRYTGAIHHAFKEARRGSACEMLPRVSSPRPVDGERRFSLSEPTLAVLLEPRSDHGTEKEATERWYDWWPQKGNELKGDSGYKPQDDSDCDA